MSCWRKLAAACFHDFSPAEYQIKNLMNGCLCVVCWSTVDSDVKANASFRMLYGGQGEEELLYT